jgi:hypothetical protein
MISNLVVGNAIEWWDKYGVVPTTPISIWRKYRNHWLRAQGICGIIKAGKKSRSIPDWWEDGTEFWFDDDIDEQIFFDKWS